MIRRFFAGLFLALSPLLCFAQTEPEYEYRYTNSGFDSGWLASPVAVTAAYVEHKNAEVGFCESGQGAGMPMAIYTMDGTTSGTVPNFTVKYWQQSRSCSTGGLGNLSARYVSPSSRVKPSPSCPVGASTSATFFSGWSTDTNGTNMVGGDVPAPSSYCDGSCTFNNPVPTQCNSDSELSPNGYYSGTCTYTYTSTGQACTVPTEDPGPTPEPPPLDPGDPGDGDPGDGDPGDGDPGDGGPGDGDPGDGDPGDGGDCVPTEQNPCDGEPGGGGGGGSNTGGGDGSDGSDGEDEGQKCGIAGLPPCSVKVDESGTASVDQLIRQVEDMHDYTQTLSGPNGEISQMNDDLKNMNPGSVFGMNDWSWSFQLPTGCTPLVMADFNVTIDPCQWQSTIHDLMSMIWIISTFFGVLWIARGTF